MKKIKELSTSRDLVVIENNTLKQYDVDKGLVNTIELQKDEAYRIKGGFSTSAGEDTCVTLYKMEDTEEILREIERLKDERGVEDSSELLNILTSMNFDHSDVRYALSL